MRPLNDATLAHLFHSPPYRQLVMTKGLLRRILDDTVRQHVRLGLMEAKVCRIIGKLGRIP